MYNKKITVSLAVSVLNEEKNIRNFLRSVLMQKEDGFYLCDIQILSDGSTDRTTEIIREFKNPKIKLTEFKQRKGKSYRLNQIYKNLTSEILVQTDSDVIFAHPRVIHDLIQPLIKQKEIGMTGGNPVPYPARTFTESSINLTTRAYSEFRQKINSGNNIFSADGRLLAFKKATVKKIRIPTDMIANDVYAYFCNLTFGDQYRYIKSAVVYFRSPQTINDQVKQNSRFLAAHTRMERYFPSDVVRAQWNIPFWLKLKVLLAQFLRSPIASLYIFLLNRYCHFKAIFSENKMSAFWEIAYSTKTVKFLKINKN